MLVSLRGSRVWECIFSSPARLCWERASECSALMKSSQSLKGALNLKHNIACLPSGRILFTSVAWLLWYWLICLTGPQTGVPITPEAYPDVPHLSCEMPYTGSHVSIFKLPSTKTLAMLARLPVSLQYSRYTWSYSLVQVLSTEGLFWVSFSARFCLSACHWNLTTSLLNWKNKSTIHHRHHCDISKLQKMIDDCLSTKNLWLSLL